MLVGETNKEIWTTLELKTRDILTFQTWTFFLPQTGPKSDSSLSFADVVTSFWTKYDGVGVGVGWGRGVLPLMTKCDSEGSLRM